MYRPWPWPAFQWQMPTFVLFVFNAAETSERLPFAARYDRLDVIMKCLWAHVLFLVRCHFSIVINYRLKTFVYLSCVCVCMRGAYLHIDQIFQCASKSPWKRDRVSGSVRERRSRRVKYTQKSKKNRRLCHSNTNRIWLAFFYYKAVGQSVPALFDGIRRVSFGSIVCEYARAPPHVSMRECDLCEIHFERNL